MEWIDDIILGLIDQHNTTDIYELCNAEEIEIVKLDPSNILLCENDAFYHRDYEGKEVIFIKDNLHPLIEQFILKHELGHALCHPNLLCAAYTFSNKGKLERQANYFALKLSNLNLDEVELRELTLEQIANYNGIPYEPLKQLVEA